MKKTAACLLVPVVLGALAGCQQTTANDTHKNTGHYAAARHMSVGSNIPQRQDTQSTSATYDPDQYQNMQNHSTGGLGGGGAR